MVDKGTSNFLPHTPLGLAMNLQLLSSKASELSCNHNRKNNNIKVNIPKIDTTNKNTFFLLYYF
jgi:hypothetical protein